MLDTWEHVGGETLDVPAVVGGGSVEGVPRLALVVLTVAVDARTTALHLSAVWVSGVGVAGAHRIWIRMDSISFVLRQPLLVSSSMQMEPPTVTWPVRNLKRGRTTRTKGGVNG